MAQEGGAEGTSSAGEWKRKGEKGRKGHVSIWGLEPNGEKKGELRAKRNGMFVLQNETSASSHMVDMGTIWAASKGERGRCREMKGGKEKRSRCCQQ